MPKQIEFNEQQIKLIQETLLSFMDNNFALDETTKVIIGQVLSKLEEHNYETNN